MAVKWTNTALAGLTLIAEYIARDHPARARSFVQEVRAKTLLLAEFPAVGRPGRVLGTREWVVHQNYIVAYRARAGQVEIIRVQHVAKKWPADFS